MMIKVCGITRLHDALGALEFGVDAIGFNFWRPGKRYIEPKRAAEISAALPKTIRKVGVFVDEDPAMVQEIAARVKLDVLQFHGAETPEYLSAFRDCPKWKALRVMENWQPATLAAYTRVYGEVEAVLLDAPGTTPGGNGSTFDWGYAVTAKRWGQIILAGGLTPENVREAIRTVKPWGVDVASGVEDSPGVKNHEKMREFVRGAREESKA